MKFKNSFLCSGVNLSLSGSITSIILLPSASRFSLSRFLSNSALIFSLIFRLSLKVSLIKSNSVKSWFTSPVRIILISLKILDSNPGITVLTVRVNCPVIMAGLPISSNLLTDILVSIPLDWLALSRKISIPGIQSNTGLSNISLITCFAFLPLNAISFPFLITLGLSLSFFLR